MICVCKPWPGYHLFECPCQVAYERLRDLERAEFELSPEEAQRQAEELVREGWLQHSRKYRRVIKCPQGSTALDEIEKLNPEWAANVREKARKFAENEARALLWNYAETKELPPQVFEAFRKAKGSL